MKPAHRIFLAILATALHLGIVVLVMWLLSFIADAYPGGMRVVTVVGVALLFVLYFRDIYREIQ